MTSLVANIRPKPDRVLTDITDYVASYAINSEEAVDTARYCLKAIIENPLGHRRRRAEGIPLLIEKFKTNLARRFPPKQSRAILELCMDPTRLHATPVNEFSDLFVI